MGRVLALEPVRHLRAILDAYGAAAGGLLGAGLAYGTVFALVPVTLLVVGIAGFFVADPAVRATVVEEAANRFPPLREFFGLALDQVARGAPQLSLVAGVALLWTASRLYGQLDLAFAVIFSETPRRDPLDRIVRGVVALVILVAIFLLLLVVGGAASTELAAIVALAPAMRVLSPAVAIVAVVLAFTVIYRVVPNRRIRWRAAFIPALVVGLVESALAALFAVVAPLLASPRVFGPFVALFASLAWLSWSYQVLLVGASWVRERSATSAGGDAPIGDPA